ncbi:MAG: DUF1674 domain-containing protein [Kiloniellales bacterium]
MIPLKRLFVSHRPRPASASRPASAKAAPAPARKPAPAEEAVQPKETGGPEGPEPTRYGDWERKGICVDF